MTVMPTLTVFLSGSVKKGADDARSPEYFWSSEQVQLLEASFPDVEVVVLNPNTVNIPKYQAHERFQADMDMLMQSQAVIVDARTKKGLGIGAEMVLARQAKIPVLTLCPLGSEYRGMTTDEAGKEREWMHPFVAELSDGVFDDLADIVEWLKQHIIPKQT